MVARDARPRRAAIDRSRDRGDVGASAASRFQRSPSPGYRGAAPSGDACHAVCHADDVSAPGAGRCRPPSRPSPSPRALRVPALAASRRRADRGPSESDEVVPLAAGPIGRLATPAGGNWMYSRATCWAKPRWTARTEAADVSSRSDPREPRAGTLTLALAPDGRVPLGALADWLPPRRTRAVAPRGKAEAIDVPTTRSSRGWWTPRWPGISARPLGGDEGPAGSVHVIAGLGVSWRPGQ